MTPRWLEGKVALVTGSSRGLGSGIVKVLAEYGATVIVHHRDSLGRARGVVQDIESAGGSATIVQADLTIDDDVRRMFEAIRRDVGPVDILVNNAGTSQSKDIFEITREDWDRLLSTNLSSTFLCCKAVAEDMKARRWGRIIMISSVVARQGALYGHVHYAASKSGMIGLAKTLARTMAPYQVTVNTLGVGMVETELLHQTLSDEQVASARGRIPLGRLLQSSEVGHLCAFLSSEHASFITGAMIDINGGMVMDG
ncbi:MAG: 3-oxoacyl-ACP reductase FabG [Phycisphaerae bacterium]|nr:3-oxoacyl-ACP reductase FabG [Phycisphaerae bacterium]